MVWIYIMWSRATCLKSFCSLCISSVSCPFETWMFHCFMMALTSRWKIRRKFKESCGQGSNKRLYFDKIILNSRSNSERFPELLLHVRSYHSSCVVLLYVHTKCSMAMATEKNREELNPQILVCEVKILLLSIIKDILT